MTAKPKNYRDVRAGHVTTPEREAAIDAEREALRSDIALHELREKRGVTQTAMAEKLSVSRPRVHTIERAGEDLRLSTMERYVNALGGELKLVAVFEDDEIQLLS